MATAGIRQDPTSPVVPSLRANGIVRKTLLACGIVSSILYVAMTVLVAMQWEAYSSAAQTISELSAIDAPTRHLWVPLGGIYGVLVSAFGWGVMSSSHRNRPLRLVGMLMVAYGALGLFWPPMHLRGAAMTLTDIMHIVFAVVTVLLMMLAIGLGATAFDRRFRLFSIATLVILLVFGALTGLGGPRIAADLPTPWIGVWERISIGAFMLWIIGLAVEVLRIPDAAAERGGRHE